MDNPEVILETESPLDLGNFFDIGYLPETIQIGFENTITIVEASPIQFVPFQAEDKK